MSATNVLEVPKDVLDSARLTIPELKIEMVVYLARDVCPSVRHENWLR